MKQRRLRLLFAFAALVLCTFGHLSLPASSAGAEGLEDLQALLQEAIDASGFDVTIAITDLQTGETAAVRGDEPRLSGCTINLLVLIQSVLDVEDGLLTKLDVDWRLRQTIYASDPHYARQLVSLIGGGDVRTGVARVREIPQRLGLTTAVFDHPPAYDHESISIPAESSLLAESTPVTVAPLPDLDAIIDPIPVVAAPDEAEALEEGAPLVVPDNVISPIDMNRLLSALWRGEILTPEWTEYLLDRLTGVSPGLQYLIGASGGGRAVVSHKNGYYWTPNGHTDNDTGIVRFSVGGVEHAYAVSYYAAQLKAEFADIVIGQRLMRLVWNYFQDRYNPT